MIEAGEDPRFIARRLVVHAAEDVDTADPQALRVAVAAAEAPPLGAGSPYPPHGAAMTSSSGGSRPCG